VIHGAGMQCKLISDHFQGESLHVERVTASAFGGLLFPGAAIEPSLRWEHGGEHVNATVTGLDGKTYRARAMTPVQRIALVSRVHYLSHVERLSVRRIVAALEDVNSVRVSVGAVHKYLNNWRCEVCQEHQEA
jgi:hypothetical protein